MTTEKPADQLNVGIAQIAPVWLHRDKTLEKIVRYVKQAGQEGCRLVAFGEALLPGYPFWIEHTDGARFNADIQKEIHSHYMTQAVQIEAGDFDSLCQAAGQSRVAVYVGCIERAHDRGGHSLYCALIYIDADGVIRSVHRKLMPTYEERLTWATGDGHGLRVHALPPFTVGGLVPGRRYAFSWYDVSQARVDSRGSLRASGAVQPFKAPAKDAALYLILKDETE